MQQDQAQVDEDALQLRRYVQAALVAKAKGSSATAYNNFVKELSAVKRKVEEQQDEEACLGLCHIMQSLTACVSVVRERKHDALVRELLSISLWKCPQAVRAEVLNLIVHLMVGSSALLNSCLLMLVQNMLPPHGWAGAASDKAAGSAAGAAWAPSAQAVEVQGQLVGALQRALQLVPTLPPNLLSLLVQNMPHKTRDRPTQCLYLRAAFALAESAQGAPLREGLLLGVVEHLLTVDVEIRWEALGVQHGQEQEEGSSEEEDGEDLFELEGMNELEISGQPHQQQQEPAGPRGGWEGAAAEGGDGGDGGEAGPSGRAAVDETAVKLDSMMELTLEHLARRCDGGDTALVWATLLASFERAVLHTHRSKFTQFLLFYVCRREPQRCCISLVRLLLARLSDARQPPITRSACAAYLASFLARSAFVPEALVVEVLQRLAEGCAAYAASVAALERSRSAPALALPGVQYGVGGAMNGGGGGSSGAAPQHQVFYAMVQALLYILCYHLEPLLTRQPHHPGTTPQHAAAVTALVQQQLVPLLSHTGLAPLAVCLASVSSEFAKQAAALQLAEVRHLLPGAAGSSTAAAAGASGAAAQQQAPARPGGVRPLEMFFPFDPYLLGRSARYLDLQHSYVRWRGGHPQAAPAEGDAVLGGSSDEEAASESESSSEGEEGGSDGADSSSENEENSSMRGDSLDSRGHMLPPRPVSGRHGRPLPVGLAAAAARGALGLGGSSLSPALPDMMATSLVAAPFLGGTSYSPGGATPPLYGHNHHLAAAAHLGGGSPYGSPHLMGATPPLGGHSPMAMSLTPYGESYMQQVPQQLAGK